MPRGCSTPPSPCNSGDQTQGFACACARVLGRHSTSYAVAAAAAFSVHIIALCSRVCWHGTCCSSHLEAACFSLFILLLACLQHGFLYSGPRCGTMLSSVRDFSFFPSALCELGSLGGFECFMRCDVVILGTCLWEPVNYTCLFITRETASVSILSAPTFPHASAFSVHRVSFLHLILHWVLHYVTLNKLLCIWAKWMCVAWIFIINKLQIAE